MVKIFISQPMTGYKDSDILITRHSIICKLKKQLKDAEFIDSFITDAPKDATPLWYISKSIESMNSADLVYFAKGWEKSNGCCIEHECAVRYNKVILYE